jgi:hypothetical protein
MIKDEEYPNLTLEEKNTQQKLRTYLADLRANAQTFTDHEKEDMRVAINSGFRSELRFLAWRAAFLQYLTIEQQYRVLQVIDELNALFKEDGDKFSEALGRGMVESIRKLPPVH